MRPTFLGFEASKSALYASQKALDITGNNLANISSEGYTRQRVDQVSVNYIKNSSRGYVNNRVSLAGEGTNVIGIGQTRDKQLDNAYRKQCGEIGGFSRKSQMLTDLEDVLQEFDLGDTGNGYGLRNAVSNLYNALQDFSSDAGSAIYASTAADAFDQISKTIRTMYTGLEETEDKYKEILQDDVFDVNDYFSKIASLNKEIKDAVSSYDYTEQYGPNELLDQRNQLIDKLSAYGDVSVVNNSDGTVDIKFGGRYAVKGNTFDTINYKENLDGTVSVTWKSDSEPVSAGNGIIDSTVGILNGRGVNIKNSTESTEKGVLYYKDKLDAFATRLVAVCNNTIPDEVDEQGNVVSYKKLFGAEMPDGKVYNDMHVIAKNIWVSDELHNDINYLLNDNGSNINNSYILNLTAKLSNTKFDFDGYYGTFEDFVNGYNTTLSGDLSYVNNCYDAAVSAGNIVDKSRESVMGVSETEETTNMLTYNRAFQAASRMMTVMDDLLDVIINQMAV